MNTIDSPLCPCGLEQEYAVCCARIHKDLQLARSAEELMRARYSAFCLKHIDFLYGSYHPTVRQMQSQKEILDWATENKWIKLEIISSSKNHVEFKAYYLNKEATLEVHHEKSTFMQSRSVWYYLSGEHA